LNADSDTIIVDRSKNEDSDNGGSGRGGSGNDGSGNSGSGNNGSGETTTKPSTSQNPTKQFEEVIELLEDFNPEYENLTISDLLNSHGWRINVQTVPYLGYRKQDLKRGRDLNKEPTIHGNCITFDTDSMPDGVDLKQNTGGGSNGLKLILNIQQDYYTDAVREMEDHSDLPFANSIAGIKVFIHDHDEVLPMYEGGIDVGPGSHASIGMVKEKYTTMWKPWGDCDEETIKLGKSDTINTCLQICYSAKHVKCYF